MAKEAQRIVALKKACMGVASGAADQAGPIGTIVLRPNVQVPHSGHEVRCKSRAASSPGRSPMGKQRIPAAVLRTAAGVEPTRLERVGAVLGKANAVPPSKVLTQIQVSARFKPSLICHLHQLCSLLQGKATRMPLLRKRATLSFQDWTGRVESVDELLVRCAALPKKRCLELSSVNKCWNFECLKVPDTFFLGKAAQPEQTARP